ncbi:GGDEF domain-containing protein [Acidaminobacter sp. JC074]|uniref:diguanylate cyclase n=1 Tax=Acidaminobacter sp. JC074 TaxID=2530199 RepID=UPI001F0EDE3B|nr:diguanylate cyclase [Acidaminobacter sp. JC074]MCH4887256.1 GGDEF domain-containing protein [Acidaminobacter sp. JC074]
MLQSKRIRNFARMQFFLTLAVLSVFAVSVYRMNGQMLRKNFIDVGRSQSEFVYNIANNGLQRNIEFGNIVARNNLVQTYAKNPDDSWNANYAFDYLQGVAQDVEDIFSVAIISYEQQDKYLRSDEENHFILEDVRYYDTKAYYRGDHTVNDRERKIYYLQMPIRVEGLVKGVVSLKVSYKEFGDRFINGNRYQKTGEFSVLDEAGLTLLSSGTDSDIEYDVDLLREATKEDGIASVDDCFFYVEIRELDEEEMIFVYKQEKSEIFRLRTQMIYQIMFAFIGIIVIYAVLSLIFSSYYKYMISADAQVVLEETVEAETKDLRKKVRLDSLTEIYNHAFLIELLDEVLVSDRIVTIMMLDIDFFKKINDEYGHPIGDQVLIEVSELLLDSIRNEDSVGRYGGEEFMIILRDTNLDIAYKVAERIRLDIMNKAFSEKTLNITASIGLAQCYGESSLDLIKQADKKLYEAKESGRNQTKK